MSSGALDLRDHDDVERVADLGDRGGEVVEAPRRVEAVDPGPELGVAHVHGAGRPRPARPGRPPCRRPARRPRGWRAGCRPSARSRGPWPTIFGFDGGKKWIIRDGRNGISRSGSGAPDGERSEEVLGAAHRVSGGSGRRSVAGLDPRTHRRATGNLGAPNPIRPSARRWATIDGGMDDLGDMRSRHERHGRCSGAGCGSSPLRAGGAAHVRPLRDRRLAVRRRRGGRDRGAGPGHRARDPAGVRRRGHQGHGRWPASLALVRRRGPEGGRRSCCAATSPASPRSGCRPTGGARISDTYLDVPLDFHRSPPHRRAAGPRRQRRAGRHRGDEPRAVHHRRGRAHRVRRDQPGPGRPLAHAARAAAVPGAGAAQPGLHQARRAPGRAGAGARSAPSRGSCTRASTARSS